MNYNPNIHHRRSIRLKGYDYSQAGLYFITICCQDRICRFGKIVGASPGGRPEMELNEFGTIAYNEWKKLSERFPYFELDVFQIMPNHMHGIMLLPEPVGARFTRAQNNNDTRVQNEIGQSQNEQPQSELGHPQSELGHPQSELGQPQGVAPTITEPKNKTVGDIIGAYKSLVANACLEIHKQKWAGVNPAPYIGKLWQRNYYEHIIRNEQSYQTISDYIINNPAKWKDDKFFSE